MVFVTAPDMAVAERLVRALVEERLAACGNILPGVVSLYRWDGVIQRDTEVMVVLKTVAAKVDALISRIDVLHPYDVPEALAVRVDAGMPSYLGWVAESTAAVDEG